MTDQPADGPDTQDRARDGLEHLQGAARELIQAARAMLDVAESLVDDPDAVAQVVGTLGTLGDLVRQTAGGASRPRPPPAARRADEAHGSGPSDDPYGADGSNGAHGARGDGGRGRPPSDASAGSDADQTPTGPASRGRPDAGRGPSDLQRITVL